MAGKVNETLWRMVRLRPATIERLRRFETIVRHAREYRDHPVNTDEQDRISLDTLINELFRRDEAHRRRSQESGKRRRKSKDQKES